MLSVEGNSLLDKSPIELHIQGYSFCGPETKLRERLAKGEQGVNKLDKFCRTHDIKYAENSNLKVRHKLTKS